MVFYLMLISDKGQPCYWTLTNDLIIYEELFKVTSVISYPTPPPPPTPPHPSYPLHHAYFQQVALAIFKVIDLCLI